MDPLFKECGSYMPGFFRMKLEFPFSSSRFAIYNLSKENQAAFFHEYIHFLQDITTYWGLNNAYVYSEYIHLACNKIYEQPSGEIHLPIKVKYDSSNVAANKWMVEQTIGDYQEFDLLFITSYCKVVLYPPFKDSYIKYITKVVLTIQGGKRIEFGARAIMESMAILLESRIAPGGRKPKEYPYNSAEYLAKFIYPGFTNDDRRIIALCDYSLMFSEPGKIFVETVEFYRIQNLLPTPEEIYKKLYYEKLQQNGKIEDIRSSYMNIALNVGERLKLYLNDSPYYFQIGRNGTHIKIHPIVAREYKQFHRAIENLIDFGIYIRYCDSLFFINMAAGGTTFCNNWLRMSLNRTGVPLIEDIYHDYYTIPSSVVTDNVLNFFFAIEQIYNTFQDGQDICDMMELCGSSAELNPPVDDRCWKEPWLRSKDYQLCPYALFWRHWNLSGRSKIIIRRNNDNR